MYTPKSINKIFPGSIKELNTVYKPKNNNFKINSIQLLQNYFQKLKNNFFKFNLYYFKKL